MKSNKLMIELESVAEVLKVRDNMPDGCRLVAEFDVKSLTPFTDATYPVVLAVWRVDGEKPNEIVPQPGQYVVARRIYDQYVDRLGGSEEVRKAA